MSEPGAAASRHRPHADDREVVIRVAAAGDVPAIKAIADREKHALGFVHRGALLRAIARDELLVANIGPSIVGFCQFYRRRDGVATVYHLAVTPDLRGQGIGRGLLAWIGAAQAPHRACVVRLKCPAEAPANGFYARVGFRHVAVEAGRGRPLHVWERRGASDPPPLGDPPAACPSRAAPD